MNGFGWPSRDTGQSRVPAPPESITGTSIQPSRLFAHAPHVGIDHHRDELLEARLRLPPELRLRLRGVAEQHVHFRRAEKLRVYDDVLVVVEADVCESQPAHLTYGGGAAGGNHVVIGRVLLQHQPHAVEDRKSTR